MMGGLMGGVEWLIPPADRNFEADIPGVGNYLIIWPALYWFAAFTGRILVLGDGIMSEFCHHVGCLSGAFTNRSIMIERGLYNKSVPLMDLRQFDMMSHFEGNPRLRNLTHLRGASVTPASEWWSYFPFLGSCVSRLSNCPPGDVSCSERFAFGKLIRGPFRHFSKSQERRLCGMPASLLQLIRTLPHANFTPELRISAAFHIRREFPHFENASDVQNDPNYLRSVYEWSNSSEAQFVYSEFVNRLLSDMPSHLAVLKSPRDDVLVYICGDNNHVKHALAQRLELAVANYLKAQNRVVRVMSIDDPLLHHSRNRLVMRNGKPFKHSLEDLAFDWYCLSISNHIYAWRNKGTRGSTFVGSAGRVSGNTSAAFSNKLQLELRRPRRGSSKYQWIKEFGYNILDHYKVF